MYDKAVLDPLNSLLSKSSKAIQKIQAGKWQHRMLENNIKALTVALKLMNGEMVELTHDELLSVLEAFDDMINRTDKSKAKFSDGTSQFTLQSNRLNALNVATSEVLNLNK